MNILLIALAALVVTFLLAYVIVNFIPRKLHWIISIALFAIAALLAVKLYDGIMKPIQFNKKKVSKFTEVIRNLKLLREAEVAHKKVTGKYTDKPQELINFIETGKFAVTEAKNVTKTKRIGGGLTTEIEVRVLDTIGYEPVKASFAGKDYKNMFKIPGTDKTFTIKTGEIEKENGNVAPVFEITVPKEVILAGMDKDLIAVEKKAIASNEIRGDMIKVGSLTEVNDNGNWPPSYDVALQTK